MLFIQLQSKSLDTFADRLFFSMKIEKRIYLDQFMLENRKIKDQCEKITEESPEFIKTGTNLYTAYGEEHTDLFKSLKTTLEFLKFKDNDEMTLVDLPEKEDKKIVYDPKDLEVTGNIKATIEVLEDAIEKVGDQANKIEESIHDYKLSLVDPNDMKNYPYDLQAIIMGYKEHDKNHYYVFIRDGVKWRRYEDEEVTEVNEESVFYEITKESKSKPEGLVYIAANNDVEINSKQKDFMLSMSRLINNTNRNINCYDSPFPYEVKRKVFEDNLKLDKEVVDNKVSQFSNKVIEIYQRRHDKLIKSKKQSNYSEWNFIAELELKKAPYYRYVLLDSIIRELSNDIISLKLLEEDDNLYKALNEATIRQCGFAAGSLKLSKEEMRQIEEYEKEFINRIVYKRMKEQVLLRLISKQWGQGLNDIEICLSNKLYCDKLAKKMMEDLLRMLSLRFISLISINLMNKNFAQLLTPLKFISRSIVKLIGVNDAHIKHSKRYLEFMLTECSIRIPKEIVQEFKNELKLLEQDDKLENTIIPINTVY